MLRRRGRRRFVRRGCGVGRLLPRLNQLLRLRISIRLHAWREMLVVRYVSLFAVVWWNQLVICSLCAAPTCAAVLFWTHLCSVQLGGEALAAGGDLPQPERQEMLHGRIRSAGHE